MTMVKQGEILVVDDQPGILETLSDILEAKGYGVATASDGFTAIRKAKEKKFDLILMDIKMPGINGVQTFREIKKIAPATAVVMMTAYAVEDLIREAIEEGAYTVVYKPFDTQKVIQTIEQVLESMLVLVVDDRLDDRQTIRDILMTKGYTVATAKDGYEAIELVKQGDFDIVMLDVKMPGIDGVKTFDEIHKIKPKIPVIMLTGYTAEEMLSEAIKKGVYACLYKPLDMDRLIQILQQVKKQKHA